MSSIETTKITGNTVRAQAVHAFLARHKAEFDQLHGDMRVAAGLSRETVKPGGSNPIDRLARLRKRIEEMREKEQALLDEITNGK